MSRIQQFIPSGDYAPIVKDYSDPLYTTSTGDMVFADTTSGTFTVNLPASPEPGDRVIFMDQKNQWSTNGLTIGRNGSNIAGNASNYSADGSSNAIEMIYSGDATQGWVVRTGGASGGTSAGEYGYSMGGHTPGYISTLARLEFANDSAGTVAVGTLTEGAAMSGGANSSEKGYAVKVYDGYNVRSAIERFDFPFDSGSSTVVGNLSATYSSMNNGINSSTHAYFKIQGSGDGYPSYIDRITFPFDSGTASNVGGWATTSARNAGSMNCNSSDYGFMIGGDGPDAGYNSHINRITFPMDSGSAAFVGNYSGGAAQYGPAYGGCCNSSNYGFIMAGLNFIPSQSWCISSVHRITFPFASGTSSAVGNLAQSHRDNSGINSTTYGYSIAGTENDTDSSGYRSWIHRLAFPFDSGTASVYASAVAGAGAFTSLDETDFITQFV